jgi:hypothetical protein
MRQPVLPTIPKLGAKPLDFLKFPANKKVGIPFCRLI